MKFRMLLSALLLAAGLVFVTGCGKKADPKAEAKKKADTPTEVVSKFIAAVKQCDFDTAAKLCDGKLKTEMEQAGKEFKTASEADKKAAKEQMAGFKAEIKGEKIEGDFAAVTFIREGKEDTSHLKKVNGEWKCIDEKDYKPAKK